MQVASKIPGRHHGYDDAIRSVRESLARLGLDHIDLYLIHWPNPSVGKYLEAWRAIVELPRARGWCGPSGSRTSPRTHLERIIDETGVTPAVNQIELHPCFPQAEMRGVHERLGIRTEAWSPLGQAPGAVRRARRRAGRGAHGVTPGQVVLRWHVQLGSCRSRSRRPRAAAAEPRRLRVRAVGDEVAAITALGRPDGRLFGGDPNTHEEM